MRGNGNQFGNHDMKSTSAFLQLFFILSVYTTHRILNPHKQAHTLLTSNKQTPC